MDRKNTIPETSALVPEELKKQMIPLFSKLVDPINLVAVLDLENEKSIEMGAFLKAIASCSDKINLTIWEKDENPEVQKELHGEHLPVVGIYTDSYTGACFHGTPGGKEINSLVAAICFASGAAQPLDKRLKKNIDSIKKKLEIKVFVSLACHHCPHVVAAAQKIAISNPNVTADMYDAKLYQDILEKYKIERVPMMVVNDSTVIMGQKSIEEIVNRLAMI